MLLAGKYLTCIFVLLTSCLILNSIAIPVPSIIQTPENDDDAEWHTKYPPDYKVGKLYNIFGADCDPIGVGEAPTHDKCKLRIRKNGLLSLRKKNKIDTKISKYTLHERIGSGSFGSVFEATRGSPEDQKATPGDPKDQSRILAKWMKFPTYGITEMSNTRLLNESVDFGIDGEKNPRLWLIIHWKEGVELTKLPSYKEATSISGTKENCMNYMGEVREAIVDASRQYVKKESAPIHNDLLIPNVLFTEKPEKRAKLIDFGKLYLTLPNEEIPTEVDEKNALDKVRKNLEKGEYQGRGKAEKNLKRRNAGGEEKNRRDEKEDAGDEDAGYVEVPEDVKDVEIPPWKLTFTDNLHCGHLNS